MLKRLLLSTYNCFAFCHGVSLTVLRLNDIIVDVCCSARRGMSLSVEMSNDRLNIKKKSLIATNKGEMPIEGGRRPEFG